MRVALYLLLILGLAAIPGSVLPQRPVSPREVGLYLQEHPAAGAVLDRLGLFDVYGSVWFSAVYLLLVVSLIGCIIPRTPKHIRDWRHAPTNPPKSSDSALELVGVELASVAAALRGGRVSRGDGYVLWRVGLLKETSNLVFHAALLAALLAVGVGSSLGYRGQVLVREDKTFTNQVGEYDTLKVGRFAGNDALPEFSLTLDDLAVTYNASGPSVGTASDYAAHVTYRQGEGTARAFTIGVNSPLDVANSSVFLVGHGYAPELVVRDSSGAEVFNDTVVLLPTDSSFDSSGVLKVPGLSPQLGVDLQLLPTADTALGQSVFPALLDPVLNVIIRRGDLGDLSAQSPYQLDHTGLKVAGAFVLRPGETLKLADGSTLEFVGVKEYATFNVASDPGQMWALAFALLAITALAGMLLLRRRTYWFVEAGGAVVVHGFGATADSDLATVRALLSEEPR